MVMNPMGLHTHILHVWGIVYTYIYHKLKPNVGKYIPVPFGAYMGYPTFNQDSRSLSRWGPALRPCESKTGTVYLVQSDKHYVLQSSGVPLLATPERDAL